MSTLIEKIRKRDKRLRYPRSILTVRTESHRNAAGMKVGLVLRITLDRYPDSGVLFTITKASLLIPASEFEECRTYETVIR